MSKKKGPKLSEMTLRDYFAACALQGLLANPTTLPAAEQTAPGNAVSYLALAAFEMASAMIAERDKK